MGDLRERVSVARTTLPGFARPINCSFVKSVRWLRKFTNEYFSELLEDKDICGLVPPYSGWMINSKDEKYVIKLLGKEEKVICPIFNLS